jgi:uncharacterized protein with GYD domain
VAQTPLLPGADMLQEQQLPVRLQHSCNLGRRPPGVRHGAEDQGRDRRVEAAVVERDAFRSGLHDLDRERDLERFDATAQAFGHVGIGFGEHQLGDGIAVVLQVQSRPGPELQHPSASVRQQIGSHIPKPRLLIGGEHAVIERREDGMAGHDLPSLPYRERELRAKDHPSERRNMALFVMLTNLTPDGVKTLKSNPNRVGEVNKEVEQIGAKVVAQYATLGQYDFVTIVEAPDEKTMAKVSVELGSRGTMSSQTMAAMKSDELASAL